MFKCCSLFCMNLVVCIGKMCYNKVTVMERKITIGEVYMGLKEKLHSLTYKCENNHSLDIASKGYVNMLLANQRHSINPGDSKEMILSRVKFLECNYYHFLRKTILEIIIKYAKKDEFNFADLACGEG